MSPHLRDISEAVGNTPLVALDELAEGDSAHLLGKCEFMNPSGSMKDRMALQVISDAERSGRLKKGDNIILLSSGNAGIALAMVCAVRGYRLTVTMSEGNSPERRKLIKALGAELVLVPQVGDARPGRVSGDDLEAVDKKTKQLAADLNAVLVDQFNDESNPAGHARTGHEIWNQTDGKVDAFVTILGTSGSFTGISRALRSHNPKIKCYAVEPASAPFLAGGKVTNVSHKLQGAGYNRPLSLFDETVCDGFLCVRDEEAIANARDLARRAGLMVGFSSGANVAASREIARKMRRDETVVTLLCDSALKYLSTDLYDD